MQDKEAGFGLETGVIQLSSFPEQPDGYYWEVPLAKRSIFHEQLAQRLALTMAVMVLLDATKAERSAMSSASTYRQMQLIDSVGNPNLEVLATTDRELGLALRKSTTIRKSSLTSLRGLGSQPVIMIGLGIRGSNGPVCSKTMPPE